MLGLIVVRVIEIWMISGFSHVTSSVTQSGPLNNDLFNTEQVIVIVFIYTYL